ncbi:MAG: hypothetical protein EA380_01720 [Phycisphaeraceae bacterium]|nr:MAG: hypothetical protein EA380_01720 [Phycisphaeraceae bacterium]
MQGNLFMNTPPPRKPYLPKPRWPAAMPGITLLQLFLIAASVCFFAAMFVPGFPWYTILLGVPLVAVPLVIITIRDCMTLNRNVRRIRELKGRVCPWCLYDLSRLPPDGRCPECSTYYEDDDLRAYWRTNTK